MEDEEDTPTTTTMRHAVEVELETHRKQQQLLDTQLARVRELASAVGAKKKFRPLIDAVVRDESEARSTIYVEEEASSVLWNTVFLRRWEEVTRSELLQEEEARGMKLAHTTSKWCIVAMRGEMERSSRELLAARLLLSSSSSSISLEHVLDDLHNICGAEACVRAAIETEESARRNALALAETGARRAHYLCENVRIVVRRLLRGGGEPVTLDAAESQERERRRYLEKRAMRGLQQLHELQQPPLPLDEEDARRESHLSDAEHYVARIATRVIGYLTDSVTHAVSSDALLSGPDIKQHMMNAAAAAEAEEGQKIVTRLIADACLYGPPDGVRPQCDAVKRTLLGVPVTLSSGAVAPVEVEHVWDSACHVIHTTLADEAEGQQRCQFLRLCVVS